MSLYWASVKKELSALDSDRSARSTVLLSICCCWAGPGAGGWSPGLGALSGGGEGLWWPCSGGPMAG